MRLADIVLGLPFLPFVIVLVALLGPSLRNIVLADRAAALAERRARHPQPGADLARSAQFVEAARVTGAGEWRIMLVHIAPNILPLSFLYGSIAVGWAILTQASVSFLGFGGPTSSRGARCCRTPMRRRRSIARPICLVRAAGPLHRPRGARRLPHQPRL